MGSMGSCWMSADQQWMQRGLLRDAVQQWCAVRGSSSHNCWRVCNTLTATGITSVPAFGIAQALTPCFTSAVPRCFCACSFTGSALLSSSPLHRPSCCCGCWWCSSSLSTTTWPFADCSQQQGHSGHWKAAQTFSQAVSVQQQQQQQQQQPLLQQQHHHHLPSVHPQQWPGSTVSPGLLAAGCSG